MKHLEGETTMKSTASPYLRDCRLADVVGAIQVMGVYPWSSRKVEDWTRKLGDPLSADNWGIVFREHPEFFRLTREEWASLRWRHGYDRVFDTSQGKELSAAECAKLSEEEQDKLLTRRPLAADQIETLLTTAVEFHSRAIAHQQERRWLIPLLFGLGTALLSFLGAFLGAVW
jgi:hypothetical protein